MKHLQLVTIILLFLVISGADPGFGLTRRAPLEPEGLPGEKVHVHTDRDIYLAGDMIFFKLYISTGKQGRTTGHSRVAYISVNSSDGKPLETMEITADSRSAHGGILLADTLRTGIYILSAWTNRMLIEGEPPYRKQFVSINRFDAGLGDFFGRNRPGREILAPQPVKGVTAEFIPSGTGAFSVLLTPDNSSEHTLSLEKAGGNIALSLDFHQQDDAVRTIRISRNRTILWEGDSRPAAGDYRFIVDPHLLGYGPLTLSVFCEREEIIMETDWYSLVPAPPSVEIQAEKDNYGTREQVILGFSNHNAVEAVASASVTVTREEGLLLNSPAITRTFSGSAAVRGIYDDASFILTGDGFMPAKLLIEPEVQYPEPQTETTIVPELRNPVISGVVTDISNGDPVADATVFLSASDTLVNLQYSRTRPDGSFHFMLNDYYRGKPVYINLPGESRDVANSRITLREKFAPLPFTPVSLLPHENIAGFIEEAITASRTRQAYNIPSYTETETDQSYGFYTIPFLYRAPTHRIRTSDYVPLDNMTEIANEIVPDLRIRGRGDNASPAVICARTRTYIGPPAFFINGVYVRGFNDIASYTSGDLSTVEVLSVPWSFGNLRFNGIVGLFSSEGNKRLPPDRHRIEIETRPQLNGIKFRNTDHSGLDAERQSFPDLRETLLWEPEPVIIDGVLQDISFYTGDLKGTYAIIVEGVTTSGDPFSTRIRISVN